MKILFRLFILSLVLISSSQLLLAQSIKFSQFPAIDNSEANLFVNQAITYVQQLYGLPKVSIQNVTIRYCPDAGAFTNLTDARKGKFTICLTRKQEEYSFYGQLAHEVGHLLNARLFDAYGEGLCTLFSRQMLEKTGKDWTGWETHYKKGGDPFYAATYFMMKEVAGIAGADSMKTFFSFAKSNPEIKNRMYIDINSWIDSLPIRKQGQIKEIISKHSKAVQETMTGSKETYSFTLPE